MKGPVPISRDGASQPATEQEPIVDHFLNINGAIMTIIKCAIGAGSFTLPRAFMDGGVYLSFFFTVFLGLLSAYTLLILIESTAMASEVLSLQQHISGGKNVLDLVEDTRFRKTEYSYIPVGDSMDYLPSSEGADKRSIEVNTLTYPEIGALAFPESDFTIQGYSFNLAFWVISIGILMTSLGVCAAYVDFISDTLPEVLRNIIGSDTIFLTRSNTPFYLLPLILGLSFLRTLKVLTYTSLIGNIAVFAGCIGVIIYGFLFYRQDLTFQHSFVEWKTLPRYIGGNTFLFAIHVVILPIMQEMDSTDSNRSKRVAIAGSFSFITIFNAIFGFVGFLLFASSECNNVTEAYIGPCDNILSNMTGGSILNAVKILVCVDLLFTVPLILAASRVIIEKAIFDSETVRAFQKKWFDQDANSNSILKVESDPVSSNGSMDSGVLVASSPRGTAAHALSTDNYDSDRSSHFTGISSDNSVGKVTDRINASTDFETDQTIDQRYNALLLLNTTFFNNLVAYSVRTTLVLTVIFMAVGIPQFGDMVDLVGGLVMPFTCFLLPSAMFVRLRHHLDRLPLIRNKSIPESSYNRDSIALTYRKKGSMSNIVYLKHVLIMIFGMVTMISTTVLSLTS